MDEYIAVIAAVEEAFDFMSSEMAGVSDFDEEGWNRKKKAALDMLKEQKLAKLIENRVICRTFDGERYLFGLATVKPEIHGSAGGTQYYVCNECKMPISPANNFCGGCGKLVKWDD